MLIMVVCYTIMGKELWGSKSIGEHTQRQYESVKSKKKVSRQSFLPPRRIANTIESLPEMKKKKNKIK